MPKNTRLVDLGGDKNQPHLYYTHFGRFDFIMLIKPSPCSSVFSTNHITIVSAIRFIMDPDISSIVVITVIAY